MDTESKILAQAIEAIDATPVQREGLNGLVAKADVSAWFETVDDSPYALADWLRALNTFESWMKEQEIVARPIDSMLGYLECCTLTVEQTLSLPDFPDLVRENLDQYGFDAARPAITELDDENA